MIYKSYLVEKKISLLKDGITLIYGENLGLQNNIKKKILAANSEAGIITVNQDEIFNNEEEFFSRLFNISLFNEMKIFIIYQVTDKILPIIEKIEKKISSQKIYLFANLLDKRSKLRNYFEKSNNLGVLPCYPDTELTLKNLLVEKLNGYNGLSPYVLNTIIDSVGIDRIKLDNEINKIKLFFSDKKIDEKNLNNLLNKTENENFNLLKDQALLGNKEKTNQLLRDTIIETEKNIFYINSINQSLIKLMQICKLRRDSSLDTAVNKIKPAIFWKDKPNFILQAKKWNKNKILEILNKTYNIELKIKSNSLIKAEILIKKLLIDICHVANA